MNLPVLPGFAADRVLCLRRARIAALIPLAVAAYWALGLARVTDLDFDLPVEAESGETGGEVDSAASAKMTLTKFGQPTEFTWSDFARVEAHPGATKAKP